MKKQIKISDFKKQNIFQIPEGYFQQLPLDIQEKIMKLNELSLEKINKKTVFKVPSTFFEQLPISIQQRIEKLSGIETKNLPKESAFTTPENYFSELSKKIASKTIDKSEFQLSNLPKEEVFSTPENYFDGLPTKIQGLIHSKQSSGKRTVLAPMLQGSMVVAGLILLIWITSLFFTNNKIEEEAVITKTEDSIKVKNTPEYIESVEDSLPQKELVLEQENEVELIEPKNNPIIPKVITEPLPVIAKGEELLDEIEINEDDLVVYLENTPVDEEELVDAILETEQAASGDLLTELLLSEEDDLYGDISDKELEELDKLLGEDYNEKD